MPRKSKTASKTPTKEVPQNNSFFEKYKHPLWQKRRLEVFKLYNFECQKCGSKEKTLNVHHQYYKKDLQPWDYPIKDFDCLCDDCHKKVHELKQILNKEAGKISASWADEMLGFIMAIQLEFEYVDEVKMISFDFTYSFCKYFQVNMRDLFEIMKDNNNTVTFSMVDSLSKDLVL